MKTANTVPKEESRQTIRIFLSYTMADRNYAQKLRILLSQLPNLRVFTPELLSAGEAWESRLKSELSQSDIFMVLLSSSSKVVIWKNS